MNELCLFFSLSAVVIGGSPAQAAVRQEEATLSRTALCAPSSLEQPVQHALHPWPENTELRALGQVLDTHTHSMSSAGRHKNITCGFI